jgi:hypothetical protein
VKLRSPLPEPVVRDRTLVIYHRRDSLWGLTRVQGLFSEFFAVLGALRYAEEHDAAGVRVWFDSALYRAPGKSPNWWSYFFAERMPLTPSAERAREVHCAGWHRYGPYAWNESWTARSLPANSGARPYPLDSVADVREAARLTARHIRVVPQWKEAVDALWQRAVTAGEFTIGLHYRGTDKAGMFPEQVPRFEAYRREIDRVLASHRPSAWKIFVATDQAEFAAWAQATYGERIFLQPVARARADDPRAARLGLHKDPQHASAPKGAAAVIDCLALARCDYLIKSRSSLSDASMAFNAALPWTLLMGNDAVRSEPAASS